MAKAECQMLCEPKGDGTSTLGRMVAFVRRGSLGEHYFQVHNLYLRIQKFQTVSQNQQPAEQELETCLDGKVTNVLIPSLTYQLPKLRS